MENENKMEKVISIIDLFSVFKRCFLFMVCAALIFGAAAGVFAEYMMQKQYAVTITFKVMAVDTSGTSGQSLSVSVVSDVIALIKSDTELAKSVLSKMTTTDANGNKVGVADSAENIKVFQDSLSTGQSSGSSLFTVTVTNADPEIAFDMAAALAEVAPEFFAQSEKVSFGNNGAEKGGMKLVRGAEMAKNSYMDPVSPNVPLIAIAGAFLGAMGCYAIFFLLFMFDTTIRNEEDLKKVCDCPVLGMIPSIVVEAAPAKKNGEGK